MSLCIVDQMKAQLSRSLREGTGSVWRERKLMGFYREKSGKVRRGAMKARKCVPFDSCVLMPGVVGKTEVDVEN